MQATQHATVTHEMISNLLESATPYTPSHDEQDQLLAAWSLGRTVRQIISADCSDGSCIDDPKQLWSVTYDLIPDLDPTLVPRARLVMTACAALMRDRGIEA